MPTSTVINEYIAGAISGAAGLIVGHPFDTAKVQMQTRQTGSPYANAFEALKSVSKQGWTRGLFRGLGFPLVSYGAVGSVFFGVYGNTASMLRGGEVRRCTYREVYVAGSVAGFAQLLVGCPVDVVKVVLQSQIPKDGAEAGRQYFRGPAQCMLWLVRRHGIRGLYRGYWAHFLRDVPLGGVYFLSYHVYFHQISETKHVDEHGIAASVLAGGLAGLTYSSLSVPADNIKSLLQADTEHKRFTGVWDCLQHVLRHRGLRGLYTGLQLTYIRTFPVNAVQFLCYSQSLKYLNHSVRTEKTANSVNA